MESACTLNNGEIRFYEIFGLWYKNRVKCGQLLVKCSLPKVKISILVITILSWNRKKTRNRLAKLLYTKSSNRNIMPKRTMNNEERTVKIPLKVIHDNQ